MLLLRTCPVCSGPNSIDVDYKKYKDYESGVFVQDAFPELNPMEREFIMTGYCPKCQELMFGTTYPSMRINALKGATHDHK